MIFVKLKIYNMYNIQIIIVYLETNALKPKLYWHKVIFNVKKNKNIKIYLSIL